MKVGPRSTRFEAESGVYLHCLEWLDSSKNDGSGVPLVLLHGGGANAHWWDHIAQKLAQFRPVYALDFRGHGDSDFPQELRVGAFSDDLEALIHRLGREDLYLVGHSMGAGVALDHASRFPQTRGIVLVDLSRGSSAGTGRRARLALSLRRTYPDREDAIQRFRFVPDSSHASESLRLHVAAHSVQQDDEGRFGYKFDPRWFGIASRPRPNPAQVACSTLLVRGEQSALLSAAAARELTRQLPKGRFVEIPNAGHHVLIDQPEALLTVLHEFLEDRAHSF